MLSWFWTQSQTCNMRRIVKGKNLQQRSQQEWNQKLLWTFHGSPVHHHVLWSVNCSLLRLWVSLQVQCHQCQSEIKPDVQSYTINLVPFLLHVLNNICNAVYTSASNKQLPSWTSLWFLYHHMLLNKYDPRVQTSVHLSTAAYGFQTASSNANVNI